MLSIIQKASRKVTEALKPVKIDAKIWQYDSNYKHSSNIYLEILKGSGGSIAVVFHKSKNKIEIDKTLKFKKIIEQFSKEHKFEGSRIEYFSVNNKGIVRRISNNNFILSNPEQIALYLNDKYNF